MAICHAVWAAPQPLGGRRRGRGEEAGNREIKIRVMKIR